MKIENEVKISSGDPGDECGPVASLEKDISFPFIIWKIFLEGAKFEMPYRWLKIGHISNEIGEKEKLFQAYNSDMEISRKK